MAAKKANSTSFKVGNDIWKRRNTSGRFRTWLDPNALWEAAQKYFEWVDNNPEEVEQSHVRLGVVKVKIKTPYLKEDIAQWLEVSHWRYIENLKEVSAEFQHVVTCIENIIVGNKKRGAYTNQFNHNIVARDLGLTDKTDITTGGEKLPQTIIKWGDKEIKV